jgi:hypothetical protein
MDWSVALGMGLLIGYALHKHLSGIADVEAEAYIAGYVDGFTDSEHKRPQKWEWCDAPKWRKSQPPPAEPR